MSGTAKSITSNPLNVINPLTPTKGLLEGYKTLGGMLSPSIPDIPVNTGSADLDALLASMRSQIAGNKQDLLTENVAATKERQQTLEQQKTERDKQVSQLANLLAEQNQRNLNLAIPNIAEQSNIKGVYRSTGLGNAIAREARNLTAATQEQLAQQKLANQEAYTQGLGSITEADIAGKGAATQRALSLGDYANQLQAGKDIGLAVMPQQPPQGKGSGGLTGALGGATVGSKFGAPGAIIGGIGGGLLGRGKK